MKLKLLKFGVSECKRTDIKNTYDSYAKFLKDNNNKILSEEEITKEFLELNIYHIEKKEWKISREKSLIEKTLKIGQIISQNNNKYLILSNEISENWNTESNFLGLSNSDFSFFQLIIKMRISDNDKFKSNYHHILNFLVKNDYKISSRIILSNESFNMIKELIKNKNIVELKKICLPCSGNGNPKKLEMTKELINLYLEIVFGNKKEVLFKEKMNVYISQFNELPKKHYLRKLFYDKDNKINFEIDSLIDRVIERIIGGSWLDYQYLIRSHLNSILCLYSFFDDELKINDKFLPILKIIISNEKLLLNLKQEKYYSSNELLKYFEIDNINLITKNEDIIKKYYNDNEINKILDAVEKDFSNNNNNQYKQIKKCISENNHLKGVISPPTFFEFICSIIIIKMIFNNSISNRNEIIKKSLNTSLDSDLRPIRFAAGRRADCVIEKDDYTIFIESTLQINGQMKMEFNSIVNHFKNKKFTDAKKILYFISPKIESLFHKHMDYEFKKNYIPFDTISLKMIVNNPDQFVIYKNYFDKKRLIRKNQIS